MISPIPGKPTWHVTHPRFKPCLGAGKRRDMTDDEFFSHVMYPVIATPKFDGIRCITMKDYLLNSHSSRPVARSLKDIPNLRIFSALATWCPPGLDGEIMTYEEPQLFNPLPRKMRAFYQIQSDVMSEQGVPDFKFHVFDHHDFEVQYPHMIPYQDRLKTLSSLFVDMPDFVVRVKTHVCECREEIEAYEQECVANGYEGICWRRPGAPYKYGRSTLREQGLIKMKRFLTSEAVVIDSYEEMGNNNPIALSPLGYSERSSHKDGMRAKGRLGGLTLKCEEFEMTFNCGSGFGALQREEYWRVRETLVGRTVTFKYQGHGGKDRPRIPIFLGFRDGRDM